MQVWRRFTWIRNFRNKAEPLYIFDDDDKEEEEDDEKKEADTPTRKR